MIMISKGKVPIGDTSYCGDATRPFWINENFENVCNCPRDTTTDAKTGCTPGSAYRVYTPCPGGLDPLNKTDDKVSAKFSYYNGLDVISDARVDLHYRGQSSKCLNPQKVRCLHYCTSLAFETCSSYRLRFAELHRQVQGQRNIARRIARVG